MDVLNVIADYFIMGSIVSFFAYAARVMNDYQKARKEYLEAQEKLRSMQNARLDAIHKRIEESQKGL